MSQTDSWRLLRSHAEEPGEIPHLRELLADDKRCEKLFLEYDGIMLDYTRQARADGVSRALRSTQSHSPRRTAGDGAHDVAAAQAGAGGAGG